MHVREPATLEAFFMMGKKKLIEIKEELAALLGKLPDRSPREWLDREIEAAKDQPDRDVATLEMLLRCVGM